MAIPFTATEASSGLPERDEYTARAAMAETALELCDRLIIDAATNSLVITDPRQPDHPIIYANPAFLQATGYSASEVLGHNCRFLQGADTDPAAVREMREAIAATRRCTVILKNYRKDGTSFWQELTLSPVPDDTGHLRYYIGVQTDITALKETQEALRHQALHDALTDLPNRVLLLDRLEQALRAARRAVAPTSFLLLDLDRFKEVNDTFGHAAGDQILCTVSTRLCALLREEDTVARLGGDEFGLVLPRTDALGAAQVAAKILRALEEPVVLEGQGVDVTTSIGIALAPAHGDDAATLLRRADLAMYAAKDAALGSAVYAADLDHATPSQLALVGELRRAIAADELVVHYQPKVALGRAHMESVEALVRWQHPQHGLIPPDQFIGLAERTGLIRSLTRGVLDTALRQCRTWRDAGRPLRVAVNISPGLVTNDYLVAMVDDLLMTHGVAATELELEITESAMLHDPAAALTILRALQQRGIRLALDDFGTGYSSLAYLKNLPIDAVKIDKAFVRDIETADDVVLARSIIELGHNLGLEVIAEGVETAVMCDRLRALGCDTVQGYFFSRPLSAADLEQWMSTTPLLHYSSCDETGGRA